MSAIELNQALGRESKSRKEPRKKEEQSYSHVTCRTFRAKSVGAGKREWYRHVRFVLWCCQLSNTTPRLLHVHVAHAKHVSCATSSAVIVCKLPKPQYQKQSVILAIR